MKPESLWTVLCVAILSMLGFGPVVLLCFFFFDGEEAHLDQYGRDIYHPQVRMNRLLQFDMRVCYLNDI